MFNGIIQHRGKVSVLNNQNKGIELSIKSDIKFKKKENGSSISCDGVCLTLESFKKNISKFYISKETISRTKFKSIKIGDTINLEKPLEFSDKVSGHYVQGHVDTIAVVNRIQIIDKSSIIEFKLRKKFIKYLVEKASITINGVSLTISKIKKNSFEVLIIPHTLKLTNLIYLKNRDIVNVEIDILSKKIKNFINEKK